MASKHGVLKSCQGCVSARKYEVTLFHNAFAKLLISGPEIAWIAFHVEGPWFESGIPYPCACWGPLLGGDLKTKHKQKMLISGIVYNTVEYKFSFN